MRTRLTRSEKRAIWDGWKAGLTLEQIVDDVDRSLGSVFAQVRSVGGIAPRPARRSKRVLQAWEREEISRGIAAGISGNEIARRLGRAPSSVSRELKRNGGREAYRASIADEAAWSRARRPQACLLKKRPRLRRWVASKLQSDWSPRQIAIGLPREFPDDAHMRVSHETIYRTLFVQARATLKAELLTHLRRKGYIRHPRRPEGSKLPSFVGGVTIHERPPEAEDRAVPGHWEGDLLMGGNSSQIATLVERRSRYVMLVKVESKSTAVVIAALAKAIRRLPAELRRSLTWDRGSEMAGHKEFTVATDVQVYFCDPHSPWQRGSNENTNGLLRQYFPKGQDLSGISQAELNRVARLLNERPRETLGALTPHEVLNQTVASTG